VNDCCKDCKVSAACFSRGVQGINSPVRLLALFQYQPDGVHLSIGAMATRMVETIPHNCPVALAHKYTRRYIEAAKKAEEPTLGRR